MAAQFNPPPPVRLFMPDTGEPVTPDELDSFLVLQRNLGRQALARVHGAIFGPPPNAWFTLDPDGPAPLMTP